MRTRIDLKGVAGAVVAASLIASLFVAANRSNADDTSPSAPAATGSATDAAPGKKAPAPPKLPEPKGATAAVEGLSDLDRSEGEGRHRRRAGRVARRHARNVCLHAQHEGARIDRLGQHEGVSRSRGAACVGRRSRATRCVFSPNTCRRPERKSKCLIRYLDEKGKMQTARAQDWIKDNHTGKPMTYPFVFAGSSFYVDPDTNKQYYQARAW